MSRDTFYTALLIAVAPPLVVLAATLLASMVS
jgi:hypothetical protein